LNYLPENHPRLFPQNVVNVFEGLFKHRDKGLKNRIAMVLPADLKPISLIRDRSTPDSLPPSGSRCTRARSAIQFVRSDGRDNAASRPMEQRGAPLRSNAGAELTVSRRLAGLVFPAQLRLDRAIQKLDGGSQVSEAANLTITA
jgi:hypothetical protein